VIVDKIDLIQKLCNIFRNGLQILLLYAISHILMQKFKHEHFFKNSLQIRSVNVIIFSQFLRVILPQAIKDESPRI
jgi:hypothetical protein